MADLGAATVGARPWGHRPETGKARLLGSLIGVGNGPRITLLTEVRWLELNLGIVQRPCVSRRMAQLPADRGVAVDSLPDPPLVQTRNSLRCGRQHDSLMRPSHTERFTTMASRPAATPSKTTSTRKAATAPPAAAAPATVVTLKALFEELGAAHELPKKQAHAMLADLVNAVTKQLKKGVRIRMSGIGTLEV